MAVTRFDMFLFNNLNERIFIKSKTGATYNGILRDYKYSITGTIDLYFSGEQVCINPSNVISYGRANMDNYERGMNVTVRDLKDCLKDLPDDMEVIVPVFDDIDNNKISGFRHVRTIGVLETPVEPNQALCIATAVSGADMYTLTDMNHLGVKCTKNLF